jgi:predicted MPP superfamily phosphohydrolase
MKGQALNLIITLAVLFFVNLYVLSGLRGASKKWKFLHKKLFPVFFWIYNTLLIIVLFWGIYTQIDYMVRLGLIVLFFLDLVFKISFIPFLIADDVRRIFLSLKNRFSSKKSTQEKSSSAPFAIPRSEFLIKAGLLAGAIPLAAIKFEMKSGIYDYHVKRHKLYLPNLPKAFDGIKLGQISDIHSGSFYNKKAVAGGVDMLMREKADFIFFTGDLINETSEEMNDYQDIFSKVKAPLGVYSCLGNHDYGDYTDWPSEQAKKKNLDDLIVCHKNMGWNLLMNQNYRLKVDGEEIGILGLENWSKLSRFPKYGKMDITVKNTDDLPVKLLLSHDPSHWRAEVLPKYPQIDVMFSGHTHGMQLGVQTPEFQWSPIEYIYNEWAGFYNEGKQQLYVNVGYGFLAPAGRVGILPEITIFELKAASAPPSNA